MSKVGQPEKMIIDGKRIDGRSFEEFRQITAEVGVLKRAEGSAIFNPSVKIFVIFVISPEKTFFPSSVFGFHPSGIETLVSFKYSSN
jgi:hypothetical protein